MTESSRTPYTLQNPAAVHDLHSEQGRLPFDSDPQLGENLKYPRNKHLSDMVHSGQLSLLYPESSNQLHQAYVVPTDGGEANRG